MSDNATERKLKQPAQVGNAIFGSGVSERLVIERAQREYEYQRRPENEAERLKRFEAFRACFSGPASAAHAELLAIHWAVMNPMEVKPEPDDTYTVSRVKEFIQRAVGTHPAFAQSEIERSEGGGR